MSLSYYALFVGSILACAVGGLIAIPAFNFLFSKSMPAGIRTAFGRILWCMASLSLGDYRLVKRANRYDLRRVIEDEDEGKHIYMGEDEENVELEDEGYVTRFGLQQFGVVWLPEGERYEDLVADEMLEDSQGKATADGGISLLNSYRGGYREFLPLVKTDEDKRLIKIDKAEEPIRNAAGASQAHKSEDVTLKKFGGGDRTSNAVIAICGLISMIFGSLMAFVVMGL